MPGTFIFKPIEANLTHSTDWLGKMDPYCVFLVENNRINSQVCRKGGKHPYWNDTITVQTAQPNAIVELKDKDTVTGDDSIGFCMIDLNEIESKGQISKWYPLYYKKKPAGQILLKSQFQGERFLPTSSPRNFTSSTQYGFNQNDYMQNQSNYTQQYTNRSTQFDRQSLAFSQHQFPSSEMILNRAPYLDESKTFVEQIQKIEPRTFLKNIDVVETRPVVKEVEVFEPQRVLKEVQYTKIVPVKKQIETIEPRVVTRDVEVLEPRIVTKHIQVIEHVPVMKKVEVVENVPKITEVDTTEPQTFTRQIEVTENIPVKKQVTVTEPITLKKTVEFVEPIITTKVVTKETRPTVIVDKKITTEVGPASLVAMSRVSESSQHEFEQFRGNYQVDEKFREMKTSEKERISYSQQSGISKVYDQNYYLEKNPGYTSSVDRNIRLGEQPSYSKALNE